VSVCVTPGNEQALTEWEYIPPVGPRPVKGFVGLKNAGATCYMNSVTQQVLFCCLVLYGIIAIWYIMYAQTFLTVIYQLYMA